MTRPIGPRPTTTVRSPALPAALIVLVALGHAGCATTRPASTSEAETVLRTIERGYRSTPDLTLEGTVRVSGMPATVWVDAMIRGRDSMKITLVGPFGIPLGAMSATPERFEFYKADEDIVVHGVPDRPTFAKLLMIPLDYDELISLLRGEIPRLPRQGEYSVEAREDELAYTVSGDDWSEEIIADPVASVVTSYRRLRRVGDTTIPELAVSYSAFMPLEQRPFARRATVDVAGGTQRISVAIDRVEAAIADDATMALDIPPGTERREFRP